MRDLALDRQPWLQPGNEGMWDWPSWRGQLQNQSYPLGNGNSLLLEEQKPFPLLLPVKLFSWHSVLPSQVSSEVLVKFIETVQQQSCFFHSIVPQTLSTGLASRRSGLRYKFLKLVSALLITLHRYHTVWIKLLESQILLKDFTEY